MADSNGLRNMAHEINAFATEARDVKVEYHNMNSDCGAIARDIKTNILISPH